MFRITVRLLTIEYYVGQSTGDPFNPRISHCRATGGVYIM